MTGAWTFALAAWRRPGVEALCLELQTLHGQSPPLLLWRLWVASQGRTPSAAALTAAQALARDWQDGVVRPLRAARDHLKSPSAVATEAQRSALRQAVLAAEIEAERLLLETLEILETSPAAGGPEDPLAGLTALARSWRPPAPQALQAREALLARLARAV